MKKFIFLATVVLLFGFADSEKVVFKSIDGKTKITASEYWTAAGNMKGVEIYISKENQKETKKTEGWVGGKKKKEQNEGGSGRLFGGGLQRYRPEGQGLALRARRLGISV